jgi:hypothetical protein
MIATCICHGWDYVWLTVGIASIAFGTFIFGYAAAPRP